MTEVSKDSFEDRLARLEARQDHLENAIDAIEARDAEFAASSNERATPFTVASISVSPESAAQ